VPRAALLILEHLDIFAFTAMDAFVKARICLKIDLGNSLHGFLADI